jgi:hypothetical protein
MFQNLPTMHENEFFGNTLQRLFFLFFIILFYYLNVLLYHVWRISLEIFPKFQEFLQITTREIGNKQLDVGQI